MPAKPAVKHIFYLGSWPLPKSALWTKGFVNQAPAVHGQNPQSFCFVKQVIHWPVAPDDIMPNMAVRRNLKPLLKIGRNFITMHQPHVQSMGAFQLFRARTKDIALKIDSRKTKERAMYSNSRRCGNRFSNKHPLQRGLASVEFPS